MEPDSWNRLSASSRRALMWADTLAHCRDELRGPVTTPSPVSPFDLLVGMLLEHPEDSEPGLLLEHFHLVPGQLLPPDYVRPTAETLKRQLNFVSTDGMPPMDQETASIVQQGTELGLRTGDRKVAELRALFAAMLDISNPVASAFGELLASRGSSLNEMARSLHDYVENHGEHGGESFSRYLQDRHPYHPKPIDIPNFKADHGGGPDVDGDLIDIGAEVDAFAYLLASRGLSPPLAVGLFGDWGSGKSFFMEALENRITQLTTGDQVRDKPQRDLPFWKRIVQIKFNAWHYVEGELWASLVNHIFKELRVGGEGDEDLVRRRRDYWLQQIDELRLEMIKLEAQRSEAERNLKAKQQQAELLRCQRDSEQAKLEHLRRQSTAAILIRDSLKEVQQTLAPYCLSLGAPTADEIYSKFDAARDELGRARTLLGLMWRESTHRHLLVGALLGVPTLVWLLSLFDFSAVTTAFGGLAATTAAALKVLDRATELTRKRLDRLEQVRGRVRQEVDQVQHQVNSRIKAAERHLQDADEELKEVLGEQKQLTDKLKSLQEALEKETPARILNEFVAERVGSADYRKHLGIPALIQRDFRQLSDLVARQNEDILKDATGEQERDDNCFNRIILYIDDLDRCPDGRVVEVLQAVHLLLAFKLFVVVVAVDSRWLRHALTKHFDALTLNAGRRQSATPDDYLEKIFQIPFWIQPIDDGARRSIVRGLLGGHLAAGVNDQAAITQGDKPTLGEPQLKALRNLDPASAPPNFEAAALSITAQELQFLDSLAPLLGRTPRSTKRFVNLYQLVRIIYHLTPDNDILAPPDHELLALVLALCEGVPTLGPRVLKMTATASPDTGFSTLLESIQPLVEAPVLASLETWLADKPDWQKVPIGRIAGALGKVDRFLFRVGTAQDNPPNVWGSC